MKNIKIAVLSVAALLSLTSCGGNAHKGTLPSGGQEVKIDTEEGASVVKKYLKDATSATIKEFNKVKASSKIEGLNADVEINSISQKDDETSTTATLPYKGKVELKDFNISNETVINGLTGKLKDLVASDESVVNGKVNAEFTIPWIDMSTGKSTAKNPNYSLEIKDLATKDYFKEGYDYFDLSSSGVTDALNGAQKIVDNIWSEFSLSIITGQSSFNITNVFEKAVGENHKVKVDAGFSEEELEASIIPEGYEETALSYVDTYIDELIADQGSKYTKFVKYNDGRFGVETTLDKSILENSVDETTLNNFSSFEVKFAAITDKSGLFANANCYANIQYNGDVSLDSSEEGSLSDIFANVSANFSFDASVDFSYGVDVNLPSDLDSYKQYTVTTINI